MKSSVIVTVSALRLSFERPVWYLPRKKIAHVSRLHDASTAGLKLDVQGATYTRNELSRQKLS